MQSHRQHEIGVLCLDGKYFRTKFTVLGPRLVNKGLLSCRHVQVRVVTYREPAPGCNFLISDTCLLPRSPSRLHNFFRLEPPCSRLES